jgi:nucleoside-diphosphate-sugar epimerase
VFHLAAQPGVRASWGASFEAYVRDNVLTSQRIFEAAARIGTRVVWASSSSIYGNAETYPTREDARPQPISPYGVTKLACEHLARAHSVALGLDHVGLRYFTVYGPRQRPDMAFTRIVRALVAGDSFVLFGTGEQSRDVTFVLDAVAATIASMTQAPTGAFYNVGGGSETTVNEVIARCEDLSGLRLDVRRESVQEGDVTRTAADTSLIREQTGWRPRYDLETGLAQHLAWAEATYHEAVELV